MGVESVERAAYRAEGHALTAERADRDAGNVQRQRPQLLREQRPECLTDRGERAGEDQELGVQGENERGDSRGDPGEVAVEHAARLAVPGPYRPREGVRLGLAREPLAVPRQPLLGGVQAELGQDAQLARAAAAPPVQLAVDHQAAGDAPSDEHAGHVVRERRRALPVLGEHREIHVVLDEDPAREVVGEAPREIQVGPVRDDHRPDPARVVDHARHADADGPDGVGPQTVVGDEAAQPSAEQLDTLRATQLLGDVLPFTRDDLAVEPGEHQHDLAQPDVDTDDMPGLGPETQPTGRTAGGAPGGRSAGLGDPALRDELVDQRLDRGPRQPGRTRQLADGLRTLPAQCPQHDTRVEPAQRRKVMPPCPSHAEPLPRIGLRRTVA